MTAENRQQAVVSLMVATLRDSAAAIAQDVAADLGAGVSPDIVEPVVRRFLDAVAAGGVRVGEADLVRLRAEGAAAARQGRPLASPIDAYLSTAWVAWDHALRLPLVDDPQVLGALGAALLRAGDDIAAALADGYTAAERALASSAGATRQAILDELLTPGVADPAAAARLLRRAPVVGFDPALTYHVLVIRPAGEPEDAGDLAEELERRLARDPTRRPHLVAARGSAVVAIAASAWREGGAFSEQTTDLATGAPWWGVVAGPVRLDGLAHAYAEALDGLRVLPAVARPGRVTPVADVALERALIADRALAAQGADRWLGPLETAGRGGPELVRTLEAWLTAGESVVATARALRVAPRTVSYRLERVASILGLRGLDAETRSRLFAALLVRRLLGASSDSVGRAGQRASDT